MTTTTPTAQQVTDMTTTYFRHFADKAIATGNANSLQFAYSLSYEDTMGALDAVRALIREGFRVVFYAERFKSRTVVAFYPEGVHPERAEYGYRTGRKVLAAYWK